MSELTIRPLSEGGATLGALAEILVQVVAGGGSVSFMHPLSPDAALAFWRAALQAAGRGERIVLGAFDGKLLAGTVSLLLACPANQPHRAEIAKLMTRPSHRGRGVALQLMGYAEALASAHCKTLLVLDTASDGGAGSLYESLGYTLAGEIPDYALKPHGGLSGTRIYWKRLPTEHQES